MKIAIMSDIHGNRYTFNIALNKIKEMNIKTIILAGDLCGYYFDSLSILKELKKFKNLYFVKGNHDDIFLNIYKTKNQKSLENYSKKYGNSIDIFLKNVNKKDINFLENLPNRLDIKLKNKLISIYHGGPKDYLNQKIMPDTDFSIFNNKKSDIFIIGHTHYRIKKMIGDKIIINPGSLGQPRDGELPSFVVFDLDSNHIEFINIEYNFMDLIKEIIKIGNQPEYNINVLKRPFVKRKEVSWIF